MADANSKLSEVDMVLIYQAKGFFEWKARRTTPLDWDTILELSGVTTITSNEAEGWVKENYVTKGFKGTDGLFAWLQGGLRLRNGLYARDVLSTQPYQPIDKSDEELNELAQIRANRFDRTVFVNYPNGQIQCDGGLTGIIEPEKTNFQSYERWNAARYLYMLLKNSSTREHGIFYDTERLQAFMLKYNVVYEGSIDQLRLDVVAFWSEMGGGISLRPHDDDQNCAIFMFHRLSRMLEGGVGLTGCYATWGLGLGYRGDQNQTQQVLHEDDVFDYLVTAAMERRELSRRRTADNWMGWFVLELFHHPNGRERFNTNSKTLTRIQFEVLRLGRSNQWFGNWKLGALWQLVKKGWLTHVERVSYSMC